MFVFSSQSQAHGGEAINEMVGYALSHKGKATAADTTYSPENGPEAYSNPAAYERISDYTRAARSQHGEDFDPATQPLDMDIVMRLGGGKQHGRYYMANSAIDGSSVPSLTQIRQRDTGSSQIPIAPR